MKDKVKNVLNTIVQEFKEGDIPKAIAYSMFPMPNIPSSNWSHLNRMLMYISGSIDARGFRQWQEVGRSVKKGSKAIYILVPLFRKNNEDSQEGDEKKQEPILYGFSPKPVFRVENTEGDVLEYEKRELPELPLMDKAREWGISVKPSFENFRFVGDYSLEKKEIRLASTDEVTFFHELSHAAQERLPKGLEKGDNPLQEIAAELSAQSLSRIVGKTKNMYVGNSYDVIEHYAEKLDITVYSACLKVLSESEKILKLILDIE